MLPYGDVDFDWLEIEKRRNLGAGYYFFSHRRIVGAIRISREENVGLQEKAGREGFRENKAYRELKAILMDFLVQLAAEFFRKGSHRRNSIEGVKLNWTVEKGLVAKPKSEATKRAVTSNGISTEHLLG